MPRTGRPPTVDADAIAVSALHLFVERGYDAATMDDVATAAGVSRSTLFRFYSSKSDLVWAGLPEANARFRESLSAAAAADLATIRAALAAALSFPVDRVQATRLRLRLIASTPSLQTVAWARQQETATMLLDALTSVPALSVDPFRARVAAAAISAGVNTALMVWAQGEADDLGVRLDDALRLLEEGLGAPSSR
ncbi:TetR family transcriptional regulator [Microbacteriaceae bacterium VKM Ac-2855]|nr:TetR family transcriptional regulator [Microbacteriaceae bacterium VKM Ac-2855]